MTDKPIIIDGVDVSGCKKYEHEIVRCNATLKNMCFCGGRCTDKKNADCYFKQLKRKEQEYDNLKAENEELRNFHINLVGVKECDIRELLKLKQTLTEIKEIAEGMHDLWINKTPYTDMDNLVKHLLDCELNRIRYKLDEIIECEVEND